MKKSSLVATLGTAALAVTMTASASYAGYMVPGETMGVSLLSPLPEGVFAADLETYGRPSSDVNIGVNIPVLIWSTPITFYNTRLEVIAAIPFAHIDGSGADRFGAITYALGPLLAHDFGGGLTGGIGALARSPDPSGNIQDVGGRTQPGVDVRQSLQYAIPAGSPFAGITLIENAAYTTCLCSNATALTSDGFLVPSTNDLFAGDFTAEKTFGKFTIGFTGFGNINTNNISRTTGVNPRAAGVEVGGLVGYDFGRFTLTGIVTHSILKNNAIPGVATGEETRGWVRVIVPIYVAPTAAPVVARY